MTAPLHCAWEYSAVTALSLFNAAPSFAHWCAELCVEVGFCRLACFASVTRYTGQSHTQYLVPDAPPLSSRSSCRGAFRAVPSSPDRVRRRVWARSTRRRPLHTMRLLLLPHTLSLVQTPTSTGEARPRQTPGRGRRKPLRALEWMEMVVGQRIVRVQMCTVAADRVRTGLTGESSSEPANPYRGHTALVSVAVCTRDTCTHCCASHITHRSKKGYGKCRNAAGVPWPDCRCQADCPPSRCAQWECPSAFFLLQRWSRSRHR